MPLPLGYMKQTSKQYYTILQQYCIFKCIITGCRKYDKNKNILKIWSYVGDVGFNRLSGPL